MLGLDAFSGLSGDEVQARQQTTAKMIHRIRRMVSQKWYPTIISERGSYGSGALRLVRERAKLIQGASRLFDPKLLWAEHAIPAVCFAQRNIPWVETRMRLGSPVHRGLRGMPTSRSLIDRSSDQRSCVANLLGRRARRIRLGLLPHSLRPWTAIVIAALFAALPIYAAERCQSCHPDEVKQYLRTGMGRSLAQPDSDQPSGVYYHGHSGTTFHVELSDRGMVHRIERNGHEASYLIDYVIGSGNAAFGYLVRVGDAIFQSPITYYSELKTWGMAPGMERYSDPDFTRPASAECLWCHAGRPRPILGSVNRYQSPPFDAEGISCDRCHGSPDEHLQTPKASNIFNPAKAAPRERDSVCEQCHLSGLARVLNPGQTFGSFEPGHRLEEFWSVFVGASDDSDEHSRFQVVSHVEQLALSRCAQSSGKELWCGSCHNPHSASDNPAVEISRYCMSCHEEDLSPSHVALANDCISCHMRKRQSHDSGHSAFTDHRISRQPAPSKPATEPRNLRPWKPQDGPLARRNLGIALIRLGQSDSPAGDIERGVRLLESVPSGRDRDPSVLEALGTGLVLSGAPAKGLGLLRKAVQADPNRSLYRNSLAAAWWNLGAGKASIREIERSIRLEPRLESGYHMLSRVNLADGNRTKAMWAWARLLEQRPRLLFAREQLESLSDAQPRQRNEED